MPSTVCKLRKSVFIEGSAQMKNQNKLLQMYLVHRLINDTIQISDIIEGWK
jgi:hypothetical protein